MLSQKESFGIAFFIATCEMVTQMLTTHQVRVLRVLAVPAPWFGPHQSGIPKTTQNEIWSSYKIIQSRNCHFVKRHP